MHLLKRFVRLLLFFVQLLADLLLLYVCFALIGCFWPRNKDEIKQNLIDQLTGAVRWTQSVQSMIADGASKFTEVGPGKVLQGLVQKINKEMLVEGVN